MDTSFYHVSERTIERVAEVAAAAVPGTRTIDAKLAGLAGRSFPRIEVRIDRNSGTAAVDADIATSYPAPVAAITDAVRATIIAHIRTLAGLDVSRVNVTVANVESLGAGTRVSWEEVASHDAFVIPEDIEVHPSEVTHPVTKERQELDPVVARSLVDDMRGVVTPAPPSVYSPEQPAPVTVSSVNTPEPVEPFSPHTPAPQALAEVRAYPTEARVPFPPEPVNPWAPESRDFIPRQPELPPLQSLAPVSVERAARPRKVEAPWRKPLREITVDRKPLKPVTVNRFVPPASVDAPAPQPMIRPVAPAPMPLKQIKIEPVVKYYDRAD